MLEKSYGLRYRLYQRTGRILPAKFRWICLEAIGVEAEAVSKYTASTSLVRTKVREPLGVHEEISGCAWMQGRRERGPDLDNEKPPIFNGFQWSIF